MAPRYDDARKLIAPYLGRLVQSKLDGVLFEDEPNTFTFRFADPDELHAQIYERFTDEIEMEPWNELVPVAAVSVPERMPDEFAYIFLDFRNGDARPGIVVATHDNWAADDHLQAKSLAALKLPA